jgi:prepilin-type N-terminal cleavage/methylation domain-containing protein
MQPHRHTQAQTPAQKELSFCAPALASWRLGGCTSPRRRRGFTIIELILVMGIMLVLISMFFIGLNYVTGTARIHDTKAALETAKTMFNEYNQATHLNRIPAYVAANWSWSTSETLPPPPPWALGPITPPTGSTPASYAWTNTTLGMDTFAVMYALEQMPANQTIINNLPASKKLTVTFSNITATFLLDSWGNPILFVPSGGLVNVRFGGQTSTVTGQSAVGTTTTAGGGQITVTSPDSRPFFVSAGPDGDVSLGDDNVYSFQ